MRGCFVITASQIHAVIRIERDLSGNALHQPVHSAVARCIILNFVTIGVDLERIIDRHRCLDWGHSIEFRLLAALGRRKGGAGAQETVYRVADLELDRLSHKLTRAGKEITLQPREFRLLEYLMKHAGQVVTRTMLLENVWDYHFDPQTNVIDVHISRLRSKIDKGHETPLLHTIRGAGYMIRDGAA